MEDLDVQMRLLDDFVTHARSQNSEHLAQHAESIKGLSSTVEQSFSNISNHFTETFSRVHELGDEMECEVKDLNESWEPTEENLMQPLSSLRHEISSTSLQEYEPTGQTPEKKQYRYPTELPRTAPVEVTATHTPDKTSTTPSRLALPPVIFNDFDASERARSPCRSTSSGPDTSLREVNPNMTATNLTAGAILFEPTASVLSVHQDNTIPMYRKSSRIPGKASNTSLKPASAAGGLENVPPSVFAQSTSRRKSPRLN